MVQEADNHWGVDLFQLQLGWHGLQALARIAQKHLEGISIGIAGVSADAAFEGEALVKECGYMRCDRGHGVAPKTYVSVCSAMPRIRVGTASRYQYVSAALLCPR